MSLHSSLRYWENITNPLPGYAEAATRGGHSTSFFLPLLLLPPSATPPSPPVVLSTHYTAHTHAREADLYCSCWRTSALIRTRFTEHHDFWSARIIHSSPPSSCPFLPTHPLPPFSSTSFYCDIQSSSPTWSRDGSYCSNTPTSTSHASTSSHTTHVCWSVPPSPSSCLCWECNSTALCWSTWNY